MLSKRLKAIVSLVETNEIIDIGCDHALIDIYLTNKGYNCTAIDKYAFNECKKLESIDIDEILDEEILEEDNINNE